MAAGKIPPPTSARSTHARSAALNDPDLDRRLTEVWGASRDSAPGEACPDGAAQQQFTPEVLARPIRTGAGRVQQGLCLLPHALRQRGQVGPDLTGAGRDNLDYLLETSSTKSATVSADFRMWSSRWRTRGPERHRPVRNAAPCPPDPERGACARGWPTPKGRRRRRLADDRRAARHAQPAEIRDLFAYLKGHVQAPLPPRPP